jgi:hypothetical protein
MKYTPSPASMTGLAVAHPVSHMAAALTAAQFRFFMLT